MCEVREEGCRAAEIFPSSGDLASYHAAQIGQGKLALTSLRGGRASSASAARLKTGARGAQGAAPNLRGIRGTKGGQAVLPSRKVPEEADCLLAGAQELATPLERLVGFNGWGDTDFPKWRSSLRPHVRQRSSGAQHLSHQSAQPGRPSAIALHTCVRTAEEVSVNSSMEYYPPAVLQLAICSNSRSPGIRGHLIRSAALDSPSARVASRARNGACDVSGNTPG